MIDNSWMRAYILSLAKLSIRDLVSEMLIYHKVFVLKNCDMNSKEFTLYKECQSELIKRYTIIKDMVNGENNG